MTRDEVRLLVEKVLDINKHDTYKIGEIVRVGQFDKYHFQLLERYSSSVKLTWKLMKYLISNGVYPACAICGEPIKNIDGNHPDGLTKGHIVAKCNGGSNKLDNQQPEHNRCNGGHGNETVRLDEYSLQLHIDVSTAYPLTRIRIDNAFLDMDIVFKAKKRKKEHGGR